MWKPVPALALVLLAGVVAACGGTADPAAPRAASESTAAPETAPVPPEEPPGPQPPPGLAQGWSTDFAVHSVPLEEIESGGPGKDGIPAIDEPRFTSVAGTDFLGDREPVIALELAGEARAYPLQILIWHEIVNDELGGVPVAVTFCPLCNTAIVFERRLADRVLDFGTTGNLRNSDLVMYDRQTESWWQQFTGEAIVGELTGSRLVQLPARLVSWAEFRHDHPDGEVLSRDTGVSRPYGDNPYQGYDDVSSPPLFAVANGDDERLPPKERVVYLEARGEAVVVPYSALRDRGELEVEVGGRSLLVRWRPGVASALGDAQIAEGEDVGAAEVLEGGAPVAFHEPFWFAVAAFRPDVRIVR